MSQRRSSALKQLHVRAAMVCVGRQMDAKVMDTSDGALTLQFILNMTTASQLSVAFSVRTGSDLSTEQAECQVIHSVCGFGGIGFKADLRFLELSPTGQATIAAYMAH